MQIRDKLNLYIQRSGKLLDSLCLDFVNTNSLQFICSKSELRKKQPGLLNKEFRKSETQNPAVTGNMGIHRRIIITHLHYSSFRLFLRLEM